MGFIWPLLIGLVVGGIARRVVPRHDQAGPIGTIVLGVTGAVFADLLTYGAGGSTVVAHAAASTAGAIVMLAGFHYLVGRHGGRR